MRRLTGIGVSPGIVAGRAVILIQRAQVLRYQIAPGRVEHELARLEQSRSRSRQQLSDIRANVARRRGPDVASLFDAQLLMLDDPMVIPRAVEIVREQRVNAEWAVQQVFHEFSAVFDEVADPYLRERRGDVGDLIGRLKMNLRQGLETARDLLRELDESSVLIADELTPSLAAQVDWTKVRGFATDAGSRTYHTAILARSLEVPGRRRAARREPFGRGRPARGRRRQRQRLDRGSERRGTGARRPSCRRSAARGGRRGGAAAAGDDRRRRPDPARREHRVSRRSGRGALRRRRGHRPVSIGVPLHQRRVRHRRRGSAVRDLPRHDRGDGARPGDDSHLRPGRRTARVARRDQGGGRSVGGQGEPRQPPRPARSASEPVAARPVSGPVARAAAGGAPRDAADHVSVRVRRRAAPRRPPDRRRGRRRPRPPRRNRAAACRSA